MREAESKTNHKYDLSYVDTHSKEMESKYQKLLAVLVLS